MRALAFAIFALCAAAPADAQTGGIQVAPVMISFSPDQSISSLRVRNGRDRPAAFEIDAYAWRQENGRDVLTPTREVIAAPGVFEMRAGLEQVVRLGIVGGGNGAAGRERAYRIILRELPRHNARGAVLGFTLEMSLPVFVTPREARPTLDARLDASADAPILRLVNVGGAHAQVAGLELDGGETVRAPRYILAGASVDIPLPSRAAAVRLAILDGASAPAERVIDVRRQTVAASVR